MDLDVPQLLAILKAIQKERPGYIAFCTADMVNGKAENWRNRYVDASRLTRNRLKQFLAEVDAEQELYVSPVVYARRSRRAQYALPLTALYMDGDGAEITADLPEPSIVLETSPGRHHYLYLLNEEVEPAKGKELNERLAAHIGADPSGADLAQLIRVPGTLNHKYDPPAEVSLIHCNLDARFDWSFFDDVLPKLVEKPQRKGRPQGSATPAAIDTSPPVPLQADDLKVWQGGDPVMKDGQVDRSATLFRIGCMLARAHLKEEDIVTAVEERDTALGYYKYSKRADADVRYRALAASAISRRKEEPRVIRALTDLGNAERFVDQHGQDVKYVAGRSWFVWDGKRFGGDDAQANLRAQRTARAIQHEANRFPKTSLGRSLGKWGRRSESANSISALLKLARDKMQVDSDQFDRPPLLLNVENGTLNLATQTLQPFSQDDMLTKLANVSWDPDASCPRWISFLETIFDGNEELIAYVQKLVGYCLTGSMDEQAFFIFHGDGANGKSTMLSVIQHLLGDYAHQLPGQALIRKQQVGIGNEFVPLCGARLAVASELNEEQRFDEAQIKQITGGDKLTVRALYRDNITFQPVFKIIVCTNKMPEITGTDLGIWRRIHLVPFNVTIPKEEQDPKLARKLIKEGPGILRWAGEGCSRWLAEGLEQPECVRVATEDFRTEMDTFAAFLKDCFVLDPSYSCTNKELWDEYEDWRQDHSDGPGFSKQKLYGEMRRRGFKEHRTSNARGYAGLQLRAKARFAHLKPLPADFIEQMKAA